jgi:hypothetical protein
MLCSDEAVNKGYQRKSSFSSWAKKNSKPLMEKKNSLDFKQRGFFIITSTWSTTNVLTGAWTDPEHHIEIRVKVSAIEIKNIRPRFKYHRLGSAGSWIQADTEVGWQHL